MDECLPPIIRDSRWFMYVFYFLAYRGRNISQVMQFKRRVKSMSDKEYTEFYASLSSISVNRAADINQQGLPRSIPHLTMP